MNGGQCVITEHTTGAIAVYRFAGDLNAEGNAELQRLINQLTASAPKRVIFDLAGVRYISSIGLGLLVNAHISLRNAGGAMIIISPQPRVRTLLDMTNLSSVLNLRADEAEALAFLNGSDATVPNNSGRH